MSIQYTNNTRSDIAISGEILPSNADKTGGTVFVLASVYRNRLYYLMRWNGGGPNKFIPYYQNSSNPGNGIITNVNEYAWVESGITYYTKNINQVPDIYIPDLPSGNNPNTNSMSMWSTDYFKYRNVNGSVVFDIYADPSGTIIADIAKSKGGEKYKEPTLKYEIYETGFNICEILSSNQDYKSNKYYFTPHFIVSDGLPTFSNDTTHYPGCDADTDKFYKTTSTNAFSPDIQCSTDGNKGKYNDQNSGFTYTNRLLTRDPPGVDQTLTTKTKLWAGITYNADADPSVYTNRKATGADKNETENYPSKTRMFGQQTYYQAPGTVANSLGGGYGGLPNGFEIFMASQGGDIGNQPNSTFRFYKNEGTASSCGADGDENLNTSEANSYLGFKFILIPVNYFSTGDCKTDKNPIYSYCSSALKSGISGREFYSTYCGDKQKTGFVKENECKLNQGSLPYYYPKYGYNQGNIVNLECGKSYIDAFGSIPGLITEDNNLRSIFGDLFPATAVNYNNNNPGSCNSTFAGCCGRTTSTGNPSIRCDTGFCNGIIPCVDGNTLNCTYVDPSGEPICSATKTTDCITPCLPDSSPLGCDIIECSQYSDSELDNVNNYTPYPGCINKCTDNNTINCYYYSDELENWVCGEDNYPPGCVDPLLQTIPCNTTGGSYPGCANVCTGTQTPTDNNCYYYSEDTWICRDNPDYPINCKELCSISDHPDGCLTVYCASTQIEDCINYCKDGQIPEDDNCVYYANDEIICVDDNFPEGCVDVCKSITAFSGTPSGCKAITCDAGGYPEGCFELITDEEPCIAENTPTGCVWKTGGSSICKSINNPPGCVYMLDSNGKPPSWSNADCAIAGNCVKVECDANNNPPGCIPRVVPPVEDSGGSAWIWIIVVLGVLIGVAAIAGVGYYIYTNKMKKEKEDKTKDIVPPGTNTVPENEFNQFIAKI